MPKNSDCQTCITAQLPPSAMPRMRTLERLKVATEVAFQAIYDGGEWEDTEFVDERDLRDAQKYVAILEVFETMPLGNILTLREVVKGMKKHGIPAVEESLRKRLVKLVNILGAKK